MPTNVPAQRGIPTNKPPAPPAERRRAWVAGKVHSFDVIISNVDTQGQPLTTGDQASYTNITIKLDAAAPNGALIGGDETDRYPIIAGESFTFASRDPDVKFRPMDIFVASATPGSNVTIHVICYG